MTFDLEDAKKRGAIYQGYPVRIICTDRASRCGYTVVALYRCEDGRHENYIAAKPDGTCTNGARLQNLPREMTVWAAAAESDVTRARSVYLYESMAVMWCRDQRKEGRAAGYAPVTIKLTK